MRNVIFMLLRVTGLPFLLRELLQRKRVSILCYHDPRPEDFERHLRVLRRLYSVISLQDYLDWWRDPQRPLPPKPLVLTFDDGHKGNYALRGVIAEAGVPVTIFLCSAVVGTHRHFWWEAHDDHDEMVRLTRLPDEERLCALEGVGFREDKPNEERQALSRAEIDDLKRFVDLQSHTRFHPVLPLCTDVRAENEIVGSKEELQRDLGLAIYALAFPNGDYSDRDVALAQRAGYTCALTLDPGYNRADTPLLTLRRLRMSDTAGEHELLVKASGLWAFLEKLFPRRAYGYVPARSDVSARSNHYGTPQW